jgi:translocator assembly and maintenance protein 41
MIDFIFAVDNSEEWHTQNLLTNEAHYSFMKNFGGSFITKVQRKGCIMLVGP